VLEYKDNQAPSPSMVSKVRCNDKTYKSDMNIEVALKEPRLYAAFYEWAVANLCAENLQFYEDADKFKNDQDDSQIEQQAEKIYCKFIKEGTFHQINLDHETKKDIALAIHNKRIHRQMFTPAQCLIMELIKYDLLVKFRESDNYKEFLGLPVAPNNKRMIIRKNSLKRVAKMPHVAPESIYHLEKCLVDPIAMDEFLSFTKAEYSDALLLFYLDVEKFKGNPSVGFAAEIFNKYLAESSVNEVDADPKIKRMIWKTIEEGAISADLYDKLQSQVFSVMAQDNFFRFQLKMISRLAIN